MFRKVSKNKALILTGIKFVGANAISLFATKTAESFGFTVVAFTELLLVFIFTNCLAKHNLLLARIVNSVVIFIINIQHLIYYFGGTYLSKMMLSNLDSLEELASNFLSYGGGFIIILAISFIPIGYFGDLKKHLCVFAMVLAITAPYSVERHYLTVTENTVKLVESIISRAKYYNKLSERKKSIPRDFFYKNRSGDFIPKPEELGDNPNVVLIFAEGLSEHIISDERDIMPYTRAFEESSLSFENYYNHTAATYNGIRGQLISGFPYADMITTNVPSLQSILSERGYNTIFINTEPNSKKFSAYVETLGFNRVITETDNLRGYSESMAAREAYTLLMNTIESNCGDSPFLIVMYDVSTHASLDSPDLRYEEGKSAELNKFYNTDFFIGNFFKWFSKSEFANDTLLVFTADHSTYFDQGYIEAFPGRNREEAFTDTEPLIIYYKDIEPKTVDVRGRNTLALTPTILDLLDIDAKNAFLGTSLFNSQPERIEFYSQCETIMKTEYGKVVKPDQTEIGEIRKKTNDYKAFIYEK